jgi:lipooligosaccharide transport system ATP-binding protein
LPVKHLITRDLRKSYSGQEVVAGINLELEAGECFGLLGPNGAGKTTTLRLCLGLTEPDAGSITMFDLPIPADARAARARVGVVPQMDNLDPDFTVSENLLTYGRYFGLEVAQIKARIPSLLEFAGLTNRAKDNIKALSGGMKRRLTLARALINDPDLIFLDEPTTGLDPQARHVIWQRLRQLLTQGKTIFLTTHFMDEAERFAIASPLWTTAASWPAARRRHLSARISNRRSLKSSATGRKHGLSSTANTYVSAASRRVRQCSATHIAWTRCLMI